MKYLNDVWVNTLGEGLSVTVLFAMLFMRHPFWSVFLIVLGLLFVGATGIRMLYIRNRDCKSKWSDPSRGVEDSSATVGKYVFVEGILFFAAFIISGFFSQTPSMFVLSLILIGLYILYAGYHLIKRFACKK